ncbi:uncharacterized protein LOC126682736 [Mercurialis annua]|uniref:uncharacterized protein LOC126682736 n=1 Tax=Mercurialis annua TaxID=3986 RepID=UPI00215E32FA|nr:uncharacterized protein LOC126682736 [Mercurialis annua]XP_050234452.1 uncharacterized protein LOC126682736 [Mercurialis annua]
MKLKILQDSLVGNKSWPRLTTGWTFWIARLRLYFKRDWERLGLLQLIRMSEQTFDFQPGMCRSFLRYWSSSANSFLFPCGPMSVTLKDVFMLTGLPVIGFDAPCLFEVDNKQLFSCPDYQSYKACIEKWCRRMETPSSQEHTEFLWVLICKFILCTPSATPTKESLRLANKLANETFVALGSVFLGALYHALQQCVTNKPLARLGGHMWLLQLWIFSYFPELKGKVPGPLRMTIADLLEAKCCLEEGAVFNFLGALTTREASAISFFDLPHHMPLWMSIFSGHRSALLLVKRKLLCAFTTSRVLFVGGSHAFSTRSSSQHLVWKIYMSSRWSRQFGIGLAQIHPFLVPYATVTEWTKSVVEKLLNMQIYYRCPLVENLSTPHDFASWWTERFQLIRSMRAASTPKKSKEKAKRKRNDSFSESAESSEKSFEKSFDVDEPSEKMKRPRRSERMVKPVRKVDGPMLDPDTVILDDDDTPSSPSSSIRELLFDAAYDKEEEIKGIDTEVANDDADAAYDKEEEIKGIDTEAANDAEDGEVAETVGEHQSAASVSNSSGAAIAPSSATSSSSGATTSSCEEPISQIKKLSSILTEEEDLVDLSFLDEMAAPEAGASSFPLPGDVHKALSAVKQVLSQHISTITDPQKEELVSSFSILRRVPDSIITSEVENEILDLLNLWRSSVEVERSDLPKLDSSKADNALYLSLGSEKREVTEKIRDIEAKGEAFEKEIQKLEEAIDALKTQQLELLEACKPLTTKYQEIVSQFQPLHVIIREKRHDMTIWVKNCAKARQDKTDCQSK